MNLGEKLKIRRKKAGYTQDEVAAKMNITRQTLSNWEVGKNYPDIDSIIKLSRIYELSLDEFLLGKILFKGAISMTRRLSETEIEKLIIKHHPSAINIKELHGGLVSQTYFFQEGDYPYILQIGNTMETYEKKKWIYNKMKSTIPVRKVLELHETEFGFAYSISEYIEGTTLHDLSTQELLDIIPAVLTALEALEKCDVSDSKGFGYFDKTGHAVYPSWLDFIEAVYNENIYNWSDLEKNGLDSEVVKTAIHELKTHITGVTLTKRNMVHGDLGSFCLLAKNNQIVGVLDWGVPLYGDHLYDKANILFWSEDRLQPLSHQITNKYIVSLESKEKIYCYMLRIGLQEIYNTVILKGIGYDIEWVANRLQQIIENHRT
ncbi:helix-turn-helix domain-containing protein [Paenibacillus sp. BC26]|uniref:helix-turn-helix domain-containing protein n=1 Tax=Paenibacillus sp. BC26 TaxID=1881032 RepID=UPI0008DF55BB|nr:helix-turn-helix domain-containing protein [Paenibacillus sp. BC26]SFT09004.1 Predicted kinase, aminoglycoside phosphotransferase (APT) family [Paenibacillus sp. BC26]